MPSSGFFRASDISKSFETPTGAVKVLDGIDVDVEENEFVCIMGASGCGKSTLIRILEGIEAPDTGEVVLEGTTLPKRPSKAAQSRFGIVFQSDNLLDWRSVYRNVELPLASFGQARGPEAEHRIMYALGLVGLTEFRDSLPSELSGGMRQRAAIARALVSDPELLLLDQPFGALDAITRQILNVQLLQIWNRTKTTCVMITNSVSEALYLAQRVIVLSPRPARIAREFRVPFTYEQRVGDNTTDPDYLALREELTRTVHALS